eukprot:15066481-Alexandrium_andersonii.AAC.1
MARHDPSAPGFAAACSFGTRPGKETVLCAATLGAQTPGAHCICHWTWQALVGDPVPALSSTCTHHAASSGVSCSELGLS